MSDNTNEPEDSPPPPTPTAEVTSWLAEYEARRRRERQEALAVARDLASQLQRLGVTRAVVHYDGSGDSGQIESVDCYASDEESAGTVAVPEELATALESVCELLCPDGYENNDGGYGTLTLEGPQRRLVLEHADRSTESEFESLSREVPPLDRGQDEGVPGEVYPALDWLAENGVQTVTVAYDGYGDEGSIEGSVCEPAPAGGVPRWVEDALEELAYHFLPGGWEINEGSDGELILDVQTRAVEVEHNRRYEDAEPYTTAWDLNTLVLVDGDPEETNDTEE